MRLASRLATPALPHAIGGDDVSDSCVSIDEDDFGMMEDAQHGEEERDNRDGGDSCDAEEEDTVDTAWLAGEFEDHQDTYFYDQDPSRRSTTGSAL